MVLGARRPTCTIPRVWITTYSNHTFGLQGWFRAWPMLGSAPFRKFSAMPCTGSRGRSLATFKNWCRPETRWAWAWGPRLNSQAHLNLATLMAAQSSERSVAFAQLKPRIILVRKYVVLIQTKFVSNDAESRSLPAPQQEITLQIKWRAQVLENGPGGEGQVHRDQCSTATIRLRLRGGQSEMSIALKASPHSLLSMSDFLPCSSDSSTGDPTTSATAQKPTATKTKK